MNIQIVFPIPADDTISHDLRTLTRILDERELANGERTGLFGGEYGYGADFENETFMLHHYCWCEKPECLWCMIWLSNEIECSEEEANQHRVKHIQQIRLLYGNKVAEAHTGAPHFFHKPSGSSIFWYKYIGRDMKLQINGKWEDIIADCHRSINKDAAMKRRKG